MPCASILGKIADVLSTMAPYMYVCMHACMDVYDLLQMDEPDGNCGREIDTGFHACIEH
jgi:hypothetical protein